MANRKSNDDVISQFDYEYDHAGNRTQIASADGSVTTYSYDAAYRLTEEHRTAPAELSWSSMSADDWDQFTADQWETFQAGGSGNYLHTFTYDPTGNRIVKNENGQRTTSTFDPANQLVTSVSDAGTTTYTFDADGNQTLVLAPNGDRTTTLWDFENKTTLIILSSGIRNTMAYDPDGLRVRLDDSTGTKKLIYDGQAYLLETDETDDLQAVYTNEPAIYGNLISQHRKSGLIWTPRYHHYDALGSTRELTDESQNITDTYLYDAWGQLLASTGSTVNPFRYVGELGYYFDPDTGNYQIRARIYDPWIGRWTSIDPLTFADGLNVYRAYFVPGLVDLNGLSICDCCNAAIADAKKTGIISDKVPRREPRRFCRVNVACSEKGCREVTQEGVVFWPARTSRSGFRSANISICIDCRVANSVLQSLIMHEMQHAKYWCQNPFVNTKSLEDCKNYEGDACQVQCDLLFPGGGQQFSQCLECCVYFRCRRLGHPVPNKSCKENPVYTKPCWKYDMEKHRFVPDPDGPGCSRRKRK